LRRTIDGREWESVPNERGYYVKHIAVGELAGEGAPPALPTKK
jgi:hypothetical protein